MVLVVWGAFKTMGGETQLCQTIIRDGSKDTAHESPLRKVSGDSSLGFKIQEHASE